MVSRTGPRICSLDNLPPRPDPALLAARAEALMTPLPSPDIS